VPIPEDASKNMLLGYHYALRQQAKKLAKEKVKIQKRKDSSIAASAAFHKACNDASYTNIKKASSAWIKDGKPRILRKAKPLQKSRLVLPIGR
jgi:hypothetical protein